MKKAVIFLTLSIITLANEYTYCGNGFSIKIENVCLDALLMESQGRISFKERKYICDSINFKLPDKKYKNITDFILRPSLARELKPCFISQEVEK